MVYNVNICICIIKYHIQIKYHILCLYICVFFFYVFMYLFMHLCIFICVWIYYLYKTNILIYIKIQALLFEWKFWMRNFICLPLSIKECFTSLLSLINLSILCIFMTVYLWLISLDHKFKSFLYYLEKFNYHWQVIIAK